MISQDNITNQVLTNTRKAADVLGFTCLDLYVCFLFPSTSTSYFTLCFCHLDYRLVDYN